MNENSNLMFDNMLPSSSNLLGLDLSGLATHVPDNVLYGALLILGIIMGGVSLVLYYHWFRYGFGDKMVVFAQILYTAVLVISFIVMISSATFYA